MIMCLNNTNLDPHLLATWYHVRDKNVENEDQR